MTYKHRKPAHDDDASTRWQGGGAAHNISSSVARNSLSTLLPEDMIAALIDLCRRLWTWSTMREMSGDTMIATLLSLPSLSSNTKGSTS